MIEVTNLEEIHLSLKSKFESLNIPVFYSEVGMDRKVISFDSEFMDDKDVMKFIEKIKPSLVIFSMFRFAINSDISHEIADEEFDSKKYLELKEELKSLAEKLYRIEIFIPCNDLLLSFTYAHEKEVEMDEFLDLEEELEGIQEALDQEEESGEKVIPYRNLSKDAIDKYVDRILNEEDFLSISTASSRVNYLTEYYIKELSIKNCYEVCRKVELALDKHIRKKVQELKSQGKKKVEVQSIMNMSKGRIDKYY